MVYTVFKGLVSLCLSQEMKILTKAIFCFQLLNHLFDGVFQIFGITHILTSPGGARPNSSSMVQSSTEASRGSFIALDTAADFPLVTLSRLW